MTALTDPPPLKPLVGVNEMVRATGLSDQSIRQHLEAGHWPGVRIGRRRAWRVPRVVLEMLLRGEDPATLKTPPCAPPAPPKPVPPVPVPPPAPTPDWLPAP